MNYSMPRQQKDEDGKPSGVWRYTTQNDGRVWASGGCANGCPGHATPEEAAEHERQFNLDTNLRLDSCSTPGTFQPCKVCGALTDKLAEIPYDMWVVRLCDDHRTREHVDTFYTGPGVGMTIHS